MSQTTNNRGKNPNNKNKKDFFHTEAGTYNSFAELKAEIEAGNVTPASLYADYEIYDASTDQAKELMELAIKKVTPKAAQPNAQVIKDKATQEAQTIKDKATQEAQTIKDQATQEAQTIKDKATQEAQTIKDKATQEAQTIKDKAAQDAAKATTDPDNKPVKKAATTKTAAAGIDALKLSEYVDNEAVIDIRMAGMQVDKLVSSINGKAVASKADLEVLGKYGLPVSIIPVRQVGKKLVVAKKSADEMSLNTIEDILQAISEDK